MEPGNRRENSIDRALDRQRGDRQTQERLRQT